MATWSPSFGASEIKDSRQEDFTGENRVARVSVLVTNEQAIPFMQDMLQNRRLYPHSTPYDLRCSRAAIRSDRGDYGFDVSGELIFPVNRIVDLEFQILKGIFYENKDPAKDWYEGLYVEEEIQPNTKLINLDPKQFAWEKIGDETVEFPVSESQAPTRRINRFTFVRTIFGYQYLPDDLDELEDNRVNAEAFTSEILIERDPFPSGSTKPLNFSAKSLLCREVNISTGFINYGVDKFSYNIRLEFDWTGVKDDDNDDGHNKFYRAFCSQSQDLSGFYKMKYSSKFCPSPTTDFVPFKTHSFANYLFPVSTP